ncbi:arginine-fifty homeobox-like [Prionailurus viverrinus]|uniref:arginine-fifty homeobox-like n=1 Tax=Prionailurus bengalensis TaxID=37029 RepID=UPI0005ACEE3B|nr:arginine-fifty homeobox-like [Prionailurus bengalensis]XP_047692038.1 arginine-fifty homeobox-like [Prionailurus viverrinus]XP_058564830.1 arginine-fifty homeobox-like [Neofelis nebulosa]
MADQRAAKPKRRSRERTSFTSHQKAELEALFSLTQFPDYVTQELLASKIHLQYTVVQGDPELDRLVATVPALSSAPYDISQVMEAYGCLEESSNTFSCLYQYLSLSDG